MIDQASKPAPPIEEGKIKSPSKMSKTLNSQNKKRTHDQFENEEGIRAMDTSKED